MMQKECGRKEDDRSMKGIEVRDGVIEWFLKGITVVFNINFLFVVSYIFNSVV
jgi:hypothetical protein